MNQEHQPITKENNKQPAALTTKPIWRRDGCPTSKFVEPSTAGTRAFELLRKMESLFISRDDKDHSGQDQKPNP